MEKASILIADTSPTFNQNMQTVLQSKGFTVYTTQDGKEALQIIQTFKPKVAYIDLLLPRQNALELLTELQQTQPEFKKKTRVIVSSNQGHVNNIKECIHRGAVDYLLKPFEMDIFIKRLAFHMQSFKQLKDVAVEKLEHRSGNYFLHLIELMLKHLQKAETEQETLFKLSQMIALTFKSIRVSIIETNPKYKRGLVRASHDDPAKVDWPLDLDKYPEILFVLNSGQTLAVENMAKDPVLSHVRASFQDIHFNSIIVAPIYKGTELWGILSIRMGEQAESLTDEEIRFAQISARLIGYALR